MSISASDPFRDSKAADSTFRIGARPDWVTEAEVPWDMPVKKDDHVAVLLVHTQMAPALFLRHERSVRRLLTREAVQKLSQVEIEWDPEIEELVVHELALWRQGVKKSFADRARFLLRQREGSLESQLVHGRMSAIALLEDVRVDDVVDLEFSIHSSARLDGEKYDTIFAVERPLATGKWIVSVRLPEEAAFHHRSDASAPSFSELRENGEIVRTWTGSQAEGKEFDSGTPPWVIPHGVIEVTGYDSWQQVAMCVAGAWEQLNTHDAAVQRQVDELIAGCSNLEERAQIVIRWVQEHVRYLGLEAGVGGLKPSAPGVVLTRLYGDCKDKTLLLGTMLRMAGVEADSVLVHSDRRHTVATALPSLGAFNHVITTFVIAGRRGFVDATMAGDGGGPFERCMVEYGKGLLISKQTTELIDITTATAERSTLLASEDFYIDRKKPACHVDWRIEATGWDANFLRARLREVGSETFAKIESEDLRQHFPDIRSTGPANAQDDLDANRIIIWGRAMFGTWGQAAGNGLRVFQYKPRWLYALLAAPQRDVKRSHPFFLRHPLNVRQEVRLHSSGHHYTRRLELQTRSRWFHSTTLIHRPDKSTVEAAYTYKSLSKTVDAVDTNGYWLDLEKAVSEQLGCNLSLTWKGPEKVNLPDHTEATLPPSRAEGEVTQPKLLPTAEENFHAWAEDAARTKSSFIRGLWQFFVWSPGGRWLAVVLFSFAGLFMKAVVSNENRDQVRASSRALPDIWRAIRTEPKKGGLPPTESQLMRIRAALAAGSAVQAGELIQNAASGSADSVHLAALTARVALMLGDHAHARRRAADALKLDAQDPIARATRGFIVLNLDKNLDEAEKIADELIQADAQNPDGWVLSSNVQHRRDRLSLAETHARKALGLDATRLDAHIALIDSLMAQNQPDEGIKVAISASKSFPQAGYLHYWLSQELGGVGRLPESLEYARLASVADDGVPLYQARYAERLAQSGNKAEALSVARKVLAMKFNDQEARSYAAMALALAGEVRSAMDVQNELVKSRGSAIDHSNLGYSLLLAEQPADAVRVLEKAVELEPQLLIAWQNLVNAYRATGATEKLAAAEKRAAELR